MWVLVDQIFVCIWPTGLELLHFIIIILYHRLYYSQIYNIPLYNLYCHILLLHCQTGIWTYRLLLYLYTMIFYTVVPILNYLLSYIYTQHFVYYIQLFYFIYIVSSPVSTIAYLQSWRHPYPYIWLGKSRTRRKHACNNTIAIYNSMFTNVIECYVYTHHLCVYDKFSITARCCWLECCILFN